MYKAKQIEIPNNSSSAKSLKDFIDKTSSKGVLSGFDISSGAGAYVTISPGILLLRTSSDFSGELQVIEIESSTDSSSFSAGDFKWVYWLYDDPSAALSLQDSFLGLRQDAVLVGTVYYDGSSFIINGSEKQSLNGGLIYNTNEIDKTISVKFNDPVISDLGSGGFSVSSSSWYINNRLISVDGFSTSSGNYKSYYLDSSSNWVVTSGVSSIDYSKYNNVSGGLSTATSGFYTVHWIYMLFDGSVHVVYGNAPYTSDIIKESEPVDDLPIHIENMGVIVGRVVYDSDDADMYHYDIYANRSLNSDVLSHSDLVGIKGGGASGDYHLDKDYRDCIKNSLTPYPTMTGKKIGKMFIDEYNSFGEMISAGSSSFTNPCISDVDNVNGVFFLRRDSTSGVAELSGYSSGDDKGIVLKGVSGKESIPGEIGRGCEAPVVIKGYKRSESDIAPLEEDEPVMVVKNGDNAIAILVSSGDLYLDATVNSYDDEDDIELIKALKNGKNKKRLKRLEELGILKNGMMSTQKSVALNMGAISQVWNVLKKIGEKVGLSEDDLMDIAKDFS